MRLVSITKILLRKAILKTLKLKKALQLIAMGFN